MKFDILCYVYSGPGRDMSSHGRANKNIAVIAIILEFSTGPSRDILFPIMTW